ncbi:hypothetical protein J6590_030612 [Homalodisca vitripennis]|nr:hypothetical protein J6590_030612 [Homalodisca vitripennis]
MGASLRRRDIRRRATTPRHRSESSQLPSLRRATPWRPSRPVLNRLFSEEEDELLVFEVQERPILWSLQQKEYKNVLKKDKEWELIGKKLSKTGGVCKKRWKSIRDNFIRSRKENHTGTGKAAKKKRAAYWEMLSFLDNGGPDEDLEAGQTFELDETALPPPQQQVKKSSQQEVGKKTKNQTTLVNMLKERMDGQKKLFECVEKLMTPQVPPIPEYEVDLFFKSMAGTVKKFTLQQIAQVKAQVFKIVNKIELSNLSFCDQSFTQTPHTSRPTSAYSSHTSTTWGEETDDSWFTQL